MLFDIAVDRILRQLISDGDGQLAGGLDLFDGEGGANVLQFRRSDKLFVEGVVGIDIGHDDTQKSPVAMAYLRGVLVNTSKHMVRG